MVAPGMARRSADLPLQQLMSGAAPGSPRQRRGSAVIAPALARRAADIPLQQLLEAQRAPTAPRYSPFMSQLLQMGWSNSQLVSSIPESSTARSSWEQ